MRDPLQLAASLGAAPLVRCLLEAKASPEGRTAGGMQGEGGRAKGNAGSPLHAAASQPSEGHLSCLVQLLEAHADPNRPDPAGATALHKAALSSPAGLSRLLAAGGEPLRTTHEGENGLHYACRAGNERTIEVLLGDTAVAAHIEAVDSEGRSALQWCILSAHEVSTLP